MANRFLVRAGYECPFLEKETGWYVVESDDMPRVGKSRGVLPDPDCKRYTDSEECEDTPQEFCRAHEVFEVRPYSDGEARRLNAREVSTGRSSCEAA
jgi:hypothetical protein